MRGMTRASIKEIHANGWIARSSPAMTKWQRLMCSADHELDRFGERVLHRRIGEQRQRVLGDGAIMAGAGDGVLHGAVAVYLRAGGGGGVPGGSCPLGGVAPKLALALRPAAE